MNDRARTVLVSGASTGIGFACAVRLAERGWSVFAGLRNLADADAFGSLGNRPVPVELDVTSTASIDSAVDRLRGEFGLSGLDAVVNNAGIAFVAPFELTAIEQWREIYDVNVFGVVALTRAVLPLLREARGRIVNIASSSATLAPPMMAAYASSKRALEALSESIRAEYAAHGIRVSVIAPDVINTPIWAKAVRALDGIAEATTHAGDPAHAKIVGSLAGRLSAMDGTGMPASRVAEVVEHALTAETPSDRYEIP